MHRDPYTITTDGPLAHDWVLRAFDPFYGAVRTLKRGTVSECIVEATTLGL